MDNYPNERKMVNDASGLNAFLTRMYGWMALSVLISAATAFLVTVGGQGAVLQMVAGHSAILWIGIIAWFVLPFVISIQAMKRPTMSFSFLMLYAVISGFVFSVIAVSYTGATISSAFVSASVVFISMSLYGLITRRNLDRIGAQASAALIALIVAMVINLFLRSSLITFVFSIIAVVIFSALTAYDTKKMKQMYNQYSGSVSMTGLAVYGALQLYLDFVNLFLQLLNIFGMVGNNK